ncbi:hypothetical protein RO3G_00210 [Rhizopus delemar RA 99-880]|uniref:PH domain-containing protein n=1 Tax=Rhizopus delemar (strain RA 99-880 / ATCC MYA-4621 / FGSC 9543 / NRRL 43880) TaxID=246409 RepID=I1BH26_RHIO9|nr:hypothetical protein RO3G_00210 [Rhizopus delemar RA 99-880]|eukprot:EIE75506.1 hypothetical protein RO3G_00210 [Rhizopus delemar RA 99-880]
MFCHESTALPIDHTYITYSDTSVMESWLYKQGRYRIIPDESMKMGEYSFQLQLKEERTLYFYTNEGNDMKLWVINLMKFTISRDFSTPVLSSRVFDTIFLETAHCM